MRMKRYAHPGLVLSVAVCFCWVSGIRPPAAYAMPSESVTMFQSAAARETQIEKVMHVLSRPDAQVQLRLAGIRKQDLRRRVERMEDSQLEWAAQRADQIQTAGFLGLIIALLVIAILIVLLLWMLNKDVDVDVHDKR